MKDWLYEAILKLFPQMRIPDEFKEMHGRLQKHGGRVVRTGRVCYNFEFDTIDGERAFWSEIVNKNTGQSC